MILGVVNILCLNPRMIFKIPEIKSTPLLNDLQQTAQEFSQIVETFEKSVDSIDYSKSTDVEKFVRFKRAKSHILDQLQFIEQQRIKRDVNFLRVEREHATRTHKPDDSQTYVETRQYIKSLDDKDRQEKLTHALENRNTIIIQAVMHWPHFLVGLTEDQHEKFCERAREVLSRDQVKEIDDAERQLKILSITLTDAIQYVNDHTIEEAQVV